MKRIYLLLCLLFLSISAIAQTTSWSNSPTVTLQTRKLSGSKQIRFIWGSDGIFSLPDSLSHYLKKSDQFSYNVLAFGAKADSTVDLSAAIDTIMARYPGGTIYIPYGKYKMLQGVTVTKPFRILGDGRFGGNELEKSLGSGFIPNDGATKIYYSGADSAAFKFSYPGSSMQAIGLMYAGSGTGIRAIELANAGHITIENNSFTSFGYGLKADSGSYEYYVGNNIIDDFRIDGLYLDNTTLPDRGDQSITNNTIMGHDSTAFAAIYIHGGGGAKIIGNKTVWAKRSTTGYKYGVYINNGTGNTSVLNITGNSFEAFTHSGVYQNNSGNIYNAINITGNEFLQIPNTIADDNIISMNGTSLTGTISGNTFENIFTTVPAIKLGSGISFWKISGNSFQNPTSNSSKISDAGSNNEDLDLLKVKTNGHVQVGSVNSNDPMIIGADITQTSTGYRGNPILDIFSTASGYAASAKFGDGVNQSGFITYRNGSTTPTMSLGLSNDVLDITDAGAYLPLSTASSLIWLDGNKKITSTTALPNGTTATTQAALSADTKIATDAYTDNAITAFKSATANLTNKTMGTNLKLQSNTGTTIDSMLFVSSQHPVSKKLIAGAGVSISQTANTVTFSSDTTTLVSKYQFLHGTNVITGANTFTGPDTVKSNFVATGGINITGRFIQSGAPASFDNIVTATIINNPGFEYNSGVGKELDMGQYSIYDNGFFSNNGGVAVGMFFPSSGDIAFGNALPGSPDSSANYSMVLSHTTGVLSATFDNSASYDGFSYIIKSYADANYAPLSSSPADTVLVSGSTSGSATFAMPVIRTNNKQVIIYCSSLTGTATWTFPTAFIHTPTIITDSGPSSSVVTSLTNTSVTITGATTTGIIILKGF